MNRKDKIVKPDFITKLYLEEKLENGLPNMHLLCFRDTFICWQRKLLKELVSWIWFWLKRGSKVRIWK